MQTPEELMIDLGYDGVKLFRNPDYTDALVGVTTDNRAVYEYGLIVRYLIETEDMSEEDAVEWIEYNTLRALPYFGDDHPVVYKNTQQS